MSFFLAAELLQPSFRWVIKTVFSLITPKEKTSVTLNEDMTKWFYFRHYFTDFEQGMAKFNLNLRKSGPAGKGVINNSQGPRFKPYEMLGRN